MVFREARPMSTSHAQVTVIRNHHAAHVLLTGEFDAPEAAHLMHELQPIVEDPPDVVVLNLGQVSFMCSSTTNVLIALRDACVAAQGEFVITDRSDCAQRLLELSGLVEYLGLTDLAPANPRARARPSRAAAGRN
jgi:anti-anti-sigma factor